MIQEICDDIVDLVTEDATVTLDTAVDFNRNLMAMEHLTNNGVFLEDAECVDEGINYSGVGLEREFLNRSEEMQPVIDSTAALDNGKYNMLHFAAYY